LVLGFGVVAGFAGGNFVFFGQPRLVPPGLARAGNDDHLVLYGGNIRLGRFDHPVDVPAGRVVDEGIDAIPVRIPTMKYVGFREGDGDVAVRMRGPIVLQGELGTVQVDGQV